ncbi:agmatinase family protein [Paraglaciecola sp. 2405UD69-4]|uniref:agmatinase family protein n=1 Tax=Paraglaciecola sp. 2405UD69-4 TaxID=3391836 RepID=UPI0039C9C6FF
MKPIKFLPHIAVMTLGIYLNAVHITSVNAKANEETNTPAWFENKTKDIPAEKLSILDSSLPTSLLGTVDRFYEAMRGKTPKEIEAYLDGMIAVANANKFNPETDMASIPLNTESPFFNSWKVERPASLNPKREPGPIHLSRYVNNRHSGVQTFAGAPLAIYPEDLIAGNVDVAIVGAPLDMGSYYRGQRFGPQAMRTGYYSGGVDMNTMINPSKILSIVDYGDIAIDNMSTEISVRHVRERVKEIAETGAIPFIVGGDHSLEYPDIAGLADVHGKGSFGVVHFDSHYDAGKNYPHWLTHGQPVYRAVKEGHVKAENFIQVGLRGAWPGPEGFEWMRNNGMRYHTMAEVEKKGWETVMKTVISEAREGGKKLFISFDVDVLDPAFVPGTGTPVPGGLTMREAIPIVRALCTENEMVGFEIVELDPLLDSTYRSALNANFIMQACLTGIAMRHQGITEGDYLSELTTEHMQPMAGEKAKAQGLAESIDSQYATPDKR